MGYIKLTEERMVVDEREIEYEEWKEHPTWVKYKVTDKTTINGEATETVRLGIAPKENIENIHSPNEKISDKVQVEHFYKGYGYIYQMSNNAWDMVMDGKLDVYRAAFPVDCDKEVQPDEFHYVLFNPFSHELAELEGTPIPTPVMISYMEGLDEKEYDLEACVNHLNKNFKNRNLQKEAYTISGIPHYNAEKDNQYQIEFLFLPTIEEYLEAKAQGGKWARQTYYIDKTLGLEQFRKQ